MKIRMMEGEEGDIPRGGWVHQDRYHTPSQHCHHVHPWIGKHTWSLIVLYLTWLVTGWFPDVQVQTFYSLDKKERNKVDELMSIKLGSLNNGSQRWRLEIKLFLELLKRKEGNLFWFSLCMWLSPSSIPCLCALSSLFAVDCCNLTKGKLWKKKKNGGNRKE